MRQNFSKSIYVLVFTLFVFLSLSSVFALEDDPFVHHLGVHFIGQISEIDYTSETLVVWHSLIATNPDTVIVQEGMGEIEFADLAVDDIVEIWGRMLAPGVVMANKILKKNPLFPPPVELIGAIEAINTEAHRLIVAGTPVQVTPFTKIKTRCGTPLSFDDLQVGQMVRVIGFTAPDESIVAHEIIVNDMLDPDRRITFIGVIEEVFYTSSSLVVNHNLVVTDEMTVIRTIDGIPLSFDELQRGNIVEVTGICLAPHRILAHEIVRIFEEPPIRPNIKIGVIYNINYEEQSYFIRHTKIVATSDTLVCALNGDPLEFADLTNGLVVLTSGTMVAEHLMEADYIRVLAEWHRPPVDVIFRGFIKSVPGYPLLIINDKPVVVTPTTHIKGFSGESLGYDNLTTASFVMVKGHKTLDDKIIAERIWIIGSIVQQVDYENLRFFTSDVEVRCTDTTPIILPDHNPGQFADLHPGLLVHVFGRFTPDGWIKAFAVKILKPFEFPGRIGDFEPVDCFSDSSGRITLQSHDNTNTFGFVDLSKDSIPIIENSIYRIKVRLVSDQVDPTVVPTIRIRVSIGSFEKVQAMIVNSAGDAVMSPTIDGKTYPFYFVPPAGIGDEGDETLKGFVSIDLINFDPSDAADATVSIDSVDVDIIPIDSVEVTATLYDFTFDTSSEGWVFRSVLPYYAEPQTLFSEGCLGLRARGLNTFGYWAAELPDAVLTGNEIYRASFIMRSETLDPALVPTMRLRLMDAMSQLGVDVVANSLGHGRYSPTHLASCYELYYQVPLGVTPPADDYLNAAFDLLHFDPDDDDDIPLLMDQVIVESLVINE